MLPITTERGISLPGHYGWLLRCAHLVRGAMALLGPAPHPVVAPPP